MNNDPNQQLEKADFLTSLTDPIARASEHARRRAFAASAIRAHRLAMSGNVVLDVVREILAVHYSGMHAPEHQESMLAEAYRIFDSQQTKLVATSQGPLAEARNADADRVQNLTREVVYYPNWDNEPEVKESPLTLDGVKITERGGITLIRASHGVGKTAVCSAMWSCAVKKDDHKGDYFGFEFNPLEDHERVLYIDTEQSRARSNITWQRAMRRAGYTKGELPSEVAESYTNILHITNPKDRLEVVTELIATSGVALCILDGIGDLLEDTNCLKESIAVCEQLRSVADASNTALVVTLHNNNKTQDKSARGHVGSELERKAVTILEISKDKDGETRKICIPTTAKNRLDSDKLEVSFGWDEREQMFKTRRRSRTPQLSRDKLELLCQVLNGNVGGMQHKELQNVLSELSGVSKRQVSNWIIRAFALEYLKKDGGIYTLASKATKQTKS